MRMTGSFLKTANLLFLFDPMRYPTQLRQRQQVEPHRVAEIHQRYSGVS